MQPTEPNQIPKAESAVAKAFHPPTNKNPLLSREWKQVQFSQSSPASVHSESFEREARVFDAGTRTLLTAKLLYRPRVFCSSSRSQGILTTGGDAAAVFPLLEKWNNLIQGVRLAVAERCRRKLLVLAGECFTGRRDSKLVCGKYSSYSFGLECGGCKHLS